jgi:hypothetical protein
VELLPGGKTMQPVNLMRTYFQGIRHFISFLQILILLGLLSQCDLIDKSENEDIKIWSVICSQAPRKSISVDYEDQGNGIIRAVATSEAVESSICGSGQPKQKTAVLLSRCLPGQVYRSDENDCKGTGNETDSYGAQKYAFCESEDTSCESDYRADPQISPAAMACANLNGIGLHWELADTEIVHSFFPKKNEILTSLIPLVDSEIFWSAQASEEKNLAYSFQLLTDQYKLIKEIKTSSHYVICVAYE